MVVAFCGIRFFAIGRKSRLDTKLGHVFIFFMA